MQHVRSHLALSLALVTELAACPAPSGFRKPHPLLVEFGAAYPPEANGVLKSFDIVAAPTELSLVDGTKMRVWENTGAHRCGVRTTAHRPGAWTAVVGGL